MEEGDTKVGDPGISREPQESALERLFQYLADGVSWLPSEGIHSGAFALERGEGGRLHIQFYIECDRKRPATLARIFQVSTPAVFDRVRDAQGAWDYCTGSGIHADKPAEARFHFGVPKLAGSSTKADLKALVDLVIEGDTLNEICKAHPYSYCVHRDRLFKFYHDWHYGVGHRHS